MNNKDLLTPRYKIIADYPNNTVRIGDICHIVNDFGQFSFGYPLHQKTLDSYHYLFKKLEWWEERKIEEMPKYLKITERVDSHDNPLPDVYVKVTKHFSEENGEWRDDSYNIFCAKDYMTNDMVSSYNYSDWLPSTEEEYLNYIKTIN